MMFVKIQFNLMWCFTQKSLKKPRKKLDFQITNKNVPYHLGFEGNITKSLFVWQNQMSALACNKLHQDWSEFMSYMDNITYDACGWGMYYQFHIAAYWTHGLFMCCIVCKHGAWPPIQYKDVTLPV